MPAVFPTGPDPRLPLRLFHHQHPVRFVVADGAVFASGLFEQVKVDAGGYGISWNDEIDLSCDELYHNGKVIPQ